MRTQTRALLGTDPSAANQAAQGGFQTVLTALAVGLTVGSSPSHTLTFLNLEVPGNGGLCH